MNNGTIKSSGDKCVSCTKLRIADDLRSMRGRIITVFNFKIKMQSYENIRDFVCYWQLTLHLGRTLYPNLA
jgi:hypothetical protein